MSLFSQFVRKPRGFQHTYIYVDERKERLAQMEESAKRELGMLPKKEYLPEDIRGRFTNAAKHLKRKRSRANRPFSLGIMIISIVLLFLLWHYLVTGSFSF